MGLTRQWLETKPAVTDKVKDGPAEFQARWKDVRELLNSAGIVCDSVNPLAEQGRQAVNASGVASPDVYKSDRTTKIVAWADAQATLLSDYPFIGSKNFDGSVLKDDAIQSDAKSYVRTFENLRIFESSPADVNLNVKAGIYVSNETFNKPKFFAASNLTIGAGDLLNPPVGTHVYALIYIDRLTGNLRGLKGTEVVLAATPAIPAIPTNGVPLGVIDLKALSINFSIDAAGNNAFLVMDLRFAMVVWP